MLIELNRPQIDIGLFTNRIEEMKAFYGGTLRLAFESELPISESFTQHRYIANGSIIKLMEARDTLARRHPGGYESLIIASDLFPQPEALHDPDGNSIVLVPPGRDDVNQLEVRMGVSDVSRFDMFYGAAGGTDIGGHRYKIGETIFAAFRHPLAKLMRPAPLANLQEVVKAMAGLGIRYVTIQVKNCEAAFKAMTDAGAAIGSPPENFANRARAAFVRDPDGNFIELAQRLT
jgi:catechol 2,3-dioxygenase-like lactoylglutathione lyase family enzyme